MARIAGSALASRSTGTEGNDVAGVVTGVVAGVVAVTMVGIDGVLGVSDILYAHKLAKTKQKQKQNTTKTIIKSNYKNEY
jgi:hypothetical protein